MDEKRKMRKAHQHRWNKEKGRLEVYEIDVPVKLTPLEKANLDKQFKARQERKEKELSPKATKVTKEKEIDE